MTRSTTAYASATQRDRVHVSSLFAYELTRITANFNACLDGETIATATWQTHYSYSALMSDPQINAAATETSILIGSQYSGPTVIKCTVTLTNGQKRVQQFRINVKSQPYYQGDQWQQGPTSLTVIAP